MDIPYLLSTKSHITLCGTGDRKPVILCASSNLEDGPQQRTSYLWVQGEECTHILIYSCFICYYIQQPASVSILRFQRHPGIFKKVSPVQRTAAPDLHQKLGEKKGRKRRIEKLTVKYIFPAFTLILTIYPCPITQPNSLMWKGIPNGSLKNKIKTKPYKRPFHGSHF